MDHTNYVEHTNYFLSSSSPIKWSKKWSKKINPKKIQKMVQIMVQKLSKK